MPISIRHVSIFLGVAYENRAWIGMDIISMGDMKVTNKPTTKFIFRIPSEGDTPLVAE